MAEQLSLTGFEPAGAPTDRLFFAILPDADAAARIVALTQRLRAQHGLKGAPLARERLHVTLYFLGDHIGVPQGIVAKASAVADALVRPSFEMLFDRVLSFGRAGRNNAFVLRGGDAPSALVDFQRGLAAALSREGLGRDMHAFVPHVTLLYDDRSVAEHSVETVQWTAKELVLVRSVLGHGRHEPMARWPLDSK
ncbi:MAG: 2,5 ligase [Rhodocyclales bacterium]|nr:2,5 ligase [Rhodocyclales bacterium]